ncbi:Rapamycin-insensitive companion of mTOR domain 4 [Trinorchestia longiramus]|nr:Rapamycin-insensitive companion of mTOR domain 4 [Trinorchestia longiramus]
MAFITPVPRWTPRSVRCTTTMFKSLLLLTLLASVACLAGSAAVRVVGTRSNGGGLLESHEMRVAVNNKFDHIFADMRQAIANSDLDPLPLPSDEDSFTVTLFNRTINGSVSVGNGDVRGLSTIHRTGNMSLQYGLLENEIIIAGEVGLTGLQVTYAAETRVGFKGSHLKITFGFPYLSVVFKTNVFINQEDIELEYCYIEDFSYSHLQLDGVGIRDEPLYELFINVLLQVVNDNVAAVVQAEIMFHARSGHYSKHLKGHRYSKTLSLDVSAGRCGVLLQVLPHVCSSSHTNALRLAYLNAAVRALRLLAGSKSLSAKESKEENSEEETSQNEKKDSDVLTNLPEQSSDLGRRRVHAVYRIRGRSKSESLKANCDTSFETLNVQQKNELNKKSYRSKKPFKNQLIDLNDSLDDGCGTHGNDIFASFSDDKTSCKNGPVDDFSLSSDITSHERSIIALQHGSNEKEALDFRESPFSMQEYFCMLRCCLVCDGHEVRASGMRLMRYLLVSQSDAEAFLGAGVVPLLIRCVDAQGGVTSVERLQSMRLLRKLLQMSSTSAAVAEDGGQESGTANQKTSSWVTGSGTGFPKGLVYALISLVRFGLEHKDPFMNPAVAVLSELLLTHPETSLSCGVVGALQNNLLEYSSAPRIHEAVLVSLLWLANTPLYRHHTAHILQVIAPYTDYHYRHTTYDLEHFTTSEERELRLSSARLCLLLLLRSWPGLLVVARHDFRALRCLTAQLSYTPHLATTAAVITVLYEFFRIRECPRVGRRREGGVEAHSSSRARDKSSTRVSSGECQQWNTLVTAHLNSPTLDPDLWTLGAGFVAAEAKYTLPRLYKCRPNPVQVQQALVLYALIKADLLPALCHVVINSPSSLALRATILLGELVHRSHRDLPVECSQLTHALPELMNQAATNFSFMDSLEYQGGAGRERRVAVTTLTNVHSGNPAVNIDLFRQRDGVFSRDYTRGVMDVRSSVLFDNAKSLIGVYSNNLGGRRKAAPDLQPTNPYSIPTTTSIVNAATAKMTQGQRGARASTAISVLLKLSRGRLNPPPLPPQHSLYLAHLLRVLPGPNSPSLPSSPVGGVIPSSGGVGLEARGSIWDNGGFQFQQITNRKKMVFTPASEEAKLSKWLSVGSNEQEELVQRALKDSHVLTLGHRHHHWHWDLIITLLRWPSEQLQRISGSTHRLFVKRVVHFYKPSAQLFSRTPADHNNASKEAEALMLLMHFLLQVPESDSGRYLEELLLDLREHLKVVCTDQPKPDVLLAPQALISYCSHYYFLMVGVLSRSPRGHLLLQQSGVLEQFLDLVTRSASDSYVKLITSSLDYSIDGLNRTILATVLRSHKVSVNGRAYGTSLLRVLLHTTSCTSTCRYLLHQLLQQLSDSSPQVVVPAISCLYELMEVPYILQTLTRTPPVLPARLGNHVHLVTARLLQVPAAYSTYQACGLVDHILLHWERSLNVAYVQMQESALLEGVTEHRRDETGRYGRRSSTPVPIHDVFVYPHLYGALVQHKLGLDRVLGQRALLDLIQRIKRGCVDTPEAVLELKAAVWGVCHTASSSAGASYITNCGALSAVAQLARHCVVYSVRGTCCMALSIVAMTHVGVLALRECGWESVVRDHHQRWQSNVHPLYDIACHHHEDDHHQQHRGPTAPFYTALQDDNYIGHTPSARVARARSGFTLGGSDGETSSDSEDDDSLVVQDLGLDDARLPPHRKAQTLPNQMRESGGGVISHQRSLSDCAPVAEEQQITAPDENTSGLDQSEQCSDLGLPPLSGGTAKAWVRRGSLRLNKLLSSMKKKKSRKRQASHTSTCSSHDTPGGNSNPFDSSPSPPVSPVCQLDNQFFSSSPSPLTGHSSTQPWVSISPTCQTSSFTCQIPPHVCHAALPTCHTLQLPSQTSPCSTTPLTCQCTSPTHHSTSLASQACSVCSALTPHSLPHAIVSSRHDRCVCPTSNTDARMSHSCVSEHAMSHNCVSGSRVSCGGRCSAGGSVSAAAGSSSAVEVHSCQRDVRSTGASGDLAFNTPAQQPGCRCQGESKLDDRLTSPQNSLSPSTPLQTSCLASPGHHAHCPCHAASSISSPPVTLFSSTGLPKTASQSSMVSVPSRVSLQGCQLLLAMSEQRRTASDSQQEQQQRHRDCLTTLLTDHTSTEHSNYFRVSGTESSKLGFSRTTSQISRISSSGSLSAHFCAAGGDTRTLALGPTTGSSSASHPFSFDAPCANSALSRQCSCQSCSVSKSSHRCTKCTSHSVSNGNATGSQQQNPHSGGVTSGSEASSLPRHANCNSCSSSCRDSMPSSCQSCLVRDRKFADAEHTVISDECGRQPSIDDSRDGSSVVTVVNRGNEHSHYSAADRGGRLDSVAVGGHTQQRISSFQTFSHRQVDQKSTILDCCGGQIYVGLCLPLDLSHLLDAKGHWDHPLGPADVGITPRMSGTADIPASATAPAEVQCQVPAEGGEAGKTGAEKDNWRESAAEKRLETVREESFNSGDGGSSTSTAVTSNTAFTSMNSGESTSDSVTDTGLPQHSKATCLGCFSLCNRQEITQPIEMVSVDQSGTSAPLTGASALLGSLRPWDLDVASRPNTPMDKWEGMTSSTGGEARTDHSRVLVRKEIVRFIIRLACPLTAKSSEAGLLSLKQRWPEAFRDVCTYSEALLLLSSASYSLSARHFLHEIFQDVSFSEVFEEAECLLRRANMSLPSDDPPPEMPNPRGSAGSLGDFSLGIGFKLKGANLLKEVLHIEEGSKQAGAKGLLGSSGPRTPLQIKSNSKEEGKQDVDVAAAVERSVKTDGDSSMHDSESRTSASNSTSNTLTGESFPYSEYHTTNTATSNSATATEKSASANEADGNRQLADAGEDRQLAEAADDRLLEEAAMAGGGIVLLTRQLTLDSSCAGADLSLSDWDGLSTDDDSEHHTPELHEDL